MISQATTVVFSNVSMGESFQSDNINLSEKNSFSFHAVFTGSPTGTFYIGVSIDNINYILLPNSSQSVSAAGEVFWDIASAGYKSAALFYTFISGSGTANASYSMKA